MCAQRSHLHVNPLAVAISWLRWGFCIRVLLCNWSLHSIEKEQQLDVSSCAVRAYEWYNKVTSPLWKVPRLVLGSEKREDYSRKLHAGNFYFIALLSFIYPALFPCFRGLFATRYSIFCSARFSRYPDVLCIWLCKGRKSTEAYRSRNLLTDLLPSYFLVEGTIMFVLECFWYWGRFWGLWQQELLACNFPFHPSNKRQIL